MACRWFTDRETGERWHVPECWGTLHNPDGECHCPDRKPDADEMPDDEGLETRMRALEDRIAKLEARK